MADLAALRKNYSARTLEPGDLAVDPVEQFLRWFEEATSVEEPEPNAMTLATATRDGAPAARVVLLKGADARGFAFYTNQTSRKGNELTDNPRAALVFHWHTLERQVRVEGTVTLVDAEEADAYFASRPLESQLGAWASPQSEVIADRRVIEERFAQALARYGASPPRPPHWGGYRVHPLRVEFWQGRPSRMHDRVRYTRDGDAWRIERLAP